LSQWWTTPLRLQVSACSNLRTMYVPSMAVFFCRESIECYPVIVSRHFLNFYFHFSWPQWSLVWQSILCPTLAEFLYVHLYILIPS
jgi:hypothetical protein